MIKGYSSTWMDEAQNHARAVMSHERDMAFKFLIPSYQHVEVSKVP